VLNPVRLLLIVLLIAPGYTHQIEKDRAERDVRFRDPLHSPLAQVGGALLEGDELLFGSSLGVDLRWTGERIEPHHLRTVSREGQVTLEALDGPVYRLGTEQRVLQERWEPDAMYQVGSVVLVLRQHPAGPLIRILDPNSERLKGFQGLKYFPVDEEFRVLGRIRPQPSREVSILDTQGWERVAWIYGQVEFLLMGRTETLDLILFDKEPGPDSAFMLIFKDKTSGKETYPACRYLYIPFQKEGEIWVDFNKAFNPSCAYAKSFACPLPPKGNQLGVPVRAGERNYEGSH
jgi:uncharacterized protein (DUF1684 family)